MTEQNGFHWEEIDVTADRGLHVEAGRLVRLFLGATYGLAGMMSTKDGADAEREWCHVTVCDCIDEEALLVEWLNELLWMAEEKGRVPIGALNMALSPAVGDDLWGIMAEVCFADVPQDGGAGIKAATYNALEIVRENGLWSVDITFDV